MIMHFNLFLDWLHRTFFSYNALENAVSLMNAGKEKKEILDW